MMGIDMEKEVIKTAFGIEYSLPESHVYITGPYPGTSRLMNEADRREYHRAVSEGITGMYDGTPPQTELYTTLPGQATRRHTIKRLWRLARIMWAAMTTREVGHE